jgi:hypothetical protein
MMAEGGSGKRPHISAQRLWVEPLDAGTVSPAGFTEENYANQ